MRIKQASIINNLYIRTGSAGGTPHMYLHEAAAIVSHAQCDQYVLFDRNGEQSYWVQKVKCTKLHFRHFQSSFQNPQKSFK